MVMELKVENQQQFNAEIQKISKGVSDLRPILHTIKKQWYKGNQSIFSLDGPGRYADIKDKQAKRRRAGIVYPILEGDTWTLKKSITEEKDEHAVSRINKKSIELGVVKTKSFPYAFSQHYGSKKINLPARPYVLLGVEQVATNDIKKQPKVYYEAIRDFILDNSEGLK